ncbi:MAG: hypothetical protein NTW21_05655 [Verrucomicrobia bacterium]|nr:hypothetical protein [Verrucomicrobiota bacterium]
MKAYPQHFFRIVPLLLASALLATAAETPKYRRLPIKEYRDKMKGAWLGQMIGVGWGQPTEFKSMGEVIPDDKMPQPPFPRPPDRPPAIPTAFTTRVS